MIERVAEHVGKAHDRRRHAARARGRGQALALDLAARIDVAGKQRRVLRDGLDLLLPVDLARARLDEPGRLATLHRQPEQRADRFYIDAPAQLRITFALGHPRNGGEVDDPINPAEAVPQMIDIGDVARGIQ